MSKERAVISPLAFEAEMANVTRTLARDGGLKVIVGGDEAYTDHETVVLPGIDRTKDMSLFEARVARGFVDHEAAHNRETDKDGGWLQKAEGHSNFAKAMVQACEDVRIEKRQTEKYNGSMTNLEATTQATLDLLLERIDGGTIPTKEDKDKHALLPFASTIAGRKLMNYGLDQSKVQKLQDACGPAVWRMAEIIGGKAMALGSTADAYQLAMWAVNNPPDPKNPPPPPPPSGGSGQGDGQGQGAGGGAGGDGQGDGDGNGANGGGGYNPSGAGHSGKPETPEPVVVDMADAVNDVLGGQMTNTTHGDAPYRGDWSLDNFISQQLTVLVDENGRRTESFRGTKNLLATTSESHAEYRKVKMAIGPQVGAIKAAFERYLMSQITRGWEGGMVQGNVDPRRLSAAVAGSQTVFRKRDQRAEIDTAVSILVDMSSSMGGTKAKMATQVCIALGEALAKVGIPFEVTAHATGGNGYGSGYAHDKNGNPFDSQSATREQWDSLPAEHIWRKIGTPRFLANGSRDVRNPWRNYNMTRWCRQDFYVLKTFNETLFNSEGPIVGLASMPHGGTTEGDGVLKTYDRLRTRPERRKVLMSLCDGGPGGYGPACESQHLHNVVKHLSKDKSLHLMAIGICDDAPSRYYPNATVIHDLGELPKTIFAKMKDALTVVKRAA